MKDSIIPKIDECLAQNFIAVGFPIGMLASPNEVDPLNHGDPLFWIRCGDKFHGVKPIPMLIWLKTSVLASGEELNQYFMENKLIETPDILAVYLTELIEAGLIVSFDKNNLSNKLLDLRVIAQGLGLGINPKNSQEFYISHFDQKPVAILDLASYILWMYFDGQRTLRQVIKDAANFLQVDQKTITERTSSLLSVLLKTRSVYFDFSSKSTTNNKNTTPKKFNYPF